MWRAKSMNPLAVLAVATAICTAAVRAEDLDASHLLGAWVLEANQPIGCGETWICAGLLVISEHRVSWLSRAATPECSADYRVTKQYVGPSFPGGRIKLVIPDNIEVRDLYVIASEQGVQIRRMNQRRDSLEDIFLRAMDNDLERAGHGRL